MKKYSKRFKTNIMHIFIQLMEQFNLSLEFIESNEHYGKIFSKQNTQKFYKIIKNNKITIDDIWNPESILPL